MPVESAAAPGAGEGPTVLDSSLHVRWTVLDTVTVLKASVSVTKRGLVIPATSRALATVLDVVCVIMASATAMLDGEGSCVTK